MFLRVLVVQHLTNRSCYDSPPSPLGGLNSPGLYFRYLSIEIDRIRLKSIKINHNRTKSIITRNCVIDFYRFRFPMFVAWLVSTTLDNDRILSTIGIIDMVRPPLGEHFQTHQTTWFASYGSNSIRRPWNGPRITETTRAGSSEDARASVPTKSHQPWQYSFVFLYQPTKNSKVSQDAHAKLFFKTVYRPS